MMNVNKNMVNYYFDEPLIKLNIFGRLLVKVVKLSFLIIIGVTTPILIFSDLNILRWLGILIGLFFVDRLIHLGQGERSIGELSFIKKKKINIALYMRPIAKEALINAYHKIQITGQNFELTLLKEMLKEKETQEIFKRLEVKEEELLNKIDDYLKQFNKSVDNETIKTTITNIARQSLIEAIATQESFINLSNVLAALMTSTEPTIIKLLDFFNLKSNDFRAAAIFGHFQRSWISFKKLPTSLGGFGHRPYRLRHRVMNRAWTARPTPTLDRFSTDLTGLARLKKTGFLIGHQTEYQKLIEALTRAGKKNILLVGEPSVGKSTIIAHLAFDLIKDKVPPALFDKRLVSLNLGDLIANAQPEIVIGRLNRIVEEIYQAGNIILHLPELGDLFKTSSQNIMNAIEALSPVLRSESFPVIAETFPRNFKQIIEPRSDILDIFEVIEVEEISREEAIIFLVFSSLILERHFKITITFPAIKKAVDLAYRYFRKKLLPSSAEELLKQAIVEAQNQHLKNLNEEMVIAVAQARSRIPLSRAGEKETEILLNLEELIHQKFINQNQAVKAVAEALRQYRSGLSRKGGPIAAFLFVGPTGVGKTELAKILAELQFGSEEMMIRLDMSEYQEKQSIRRFLGSTEGGLVSSLTDAVFQKPYSLVLLDEFEKAHPDILNLFLQVFDDGRLTDAFGRTVDFQNTIIIATSNAHSEFIKEEIEKSQPIEQIGVELKKKLTSVFRPELLNRFSDIIVFRNLNLEEIASVVKIQLNSLAKIIKETHGINVIFDETAVKKIAELGYSPIFGARPLRQAIAENIKSKFAEKILKKEIGRGNEILVSVSNNDFDFKITT